MKPREYRWTIILTQYKYILILNELNYTFITSLFNINKLLKNTY